MAGANILVVEDQRAVAGALRMRLRGLGYAVTGIATDGNEAIEKAGELRPDLILMDIRLGDGMDGIEAAHRIRAELDIPVVYVSAYADRELLDRARETRPAGFINKPFTTKDLLTTINLALDKGGRDEASDEEAAVVDARPARDAVLTTDLEARVSFISRSAEELTGWSRESIVGKPLENGLSALYGITQGEAHKIIQEVLALGKEHALVREKHGRGRVSDILTPLRDAQGNHFGVALRFGPETVNTSVAALQRMVDAFTFIIDRIPIGVVLVDRHLKVLHTNARSIATVENNPGIVEVHGHLRALDDSQHAELHALVRRAVDRSDIGGTGAATSEMLSLSDPAGTSTITFVATPVPVPGPPAGGKHRVALFVFDRAGNRELSAPALRQMFGFTRSEARLVQALSGGGSLEDGAAMLGISVNTARTHLKHIFHKTGAKRQSELIHQVENSPAALPLDYEQGEPDPKSH